MNLAEKDIMVSSDEKFIWQILETVTDPEVPVLSIIDLGIVRAVTISPSLLIAIGVEKGLGVEGFPQEDTTKSRPEATGLPVCLILEMLRRF